ncbi:MAG: beta-ketoacyl-ACP synthase [Lentisphaeraceae bacterium]|nr:beta-ketoacyl-ACP synthase [Lentisphaeraceae bacterium]
MKQAIVDFGLVSSIGSGKEETSKHLFADKRSGLSETTLINGKKSFIGSVQTPLAEIPAELKDLKSRNNQLLLTVFKQIENSFNELSKGIAQKKIGIVLGTSTSGISDVEKAFSHKHENGEFPSDYHYKKHEMSSPSEFLAKLTNCKGPVYTVSCACSSGSKAIASASRLLSSGICNIVICGGVDTLCNLTLLGFDSLEVISEKQSIPFSKNRDGINIGEAGALFLMTNKAGKLNLCGYGESSDAYHQSAPDPEGAGAISAMKNALDLAELNASDIDYINLHGTSTPQNDFMEAKAVNSVFSNTTPASSTKSLTGHTLGAAGAIEAAFSLLCIENKQFPIHHWDGEVDETLADIQLTSSTNSDKSLKYVMSNSYAFGGNNCSLIFGGES